MLQPFSAVIQAEVEFESTRIIHEALGISANMTPPHRVFTLELIIIRLPAACTYQMGPRSGNWRKIGR